jgi:predicted metalloprotease with PDZ domain
MEGFNDYLALLAATASGVVTPEWFAQRLARISDDLAALPPSQPRALTAPGMVARDNDGPAETMAYRGGALAAFGFDVALRASNKGTIGDFVGRLLTSPHAAISEQAIHDMAGALGVTAQFNAAVGASRMTSPWEALRSIGYVFTEEPASLQALGIAADAAGRASHLTMGPAVVRAIDPNGPSAAADIVPGDTVIIRINRRSHPPIHVAGIAAATLGEYTFASSVIPSNAQQLRIQVRRSGETRTVTVTPRAVSGGVRFAPRWDASNGSSFFKAPVTR